MYLCAIRLRILPNVSSTPKRPIVLYTRIRSFFFHTNRYILYGLMLMLVWPGSVLAQLSNGGSPKGWQQGNWKSIPTVSPDAALLGMELLHLQQVPPTDETTGRPFQFGIPLEVSYSPQNSGVWQTLPDGGRIWRLAIRSPGAYSINLVFEQYRLLPGAELFLYDREGKMLLGAYTSLNNQEDYKLGVQPIKGDEVIVEYYEPAALKNTGVLEIGQVVHAYRNIFDEAYGFGDAVACHVNVNCPEGATWQTHKRSVVLILAGGSLCSGAFVNNTAEDGRPYLLTADHCFSESVSTWVYVFNYESPDCSIQEGLTHQTMSGAVVRARNSASDFMLLELNQKPPTEYQVYYAGWSRTTEAPASVVGIHHPAGDTKKISTRSTAPATGEWPGTGLLNHWEVAGWASGTTEGGSSGAPLFDSDGRIIGQLHGGSSASCPGSNKVSLYGKLDYSWQTGTAVSQRLKEWLDPLGTNPVLLDGAESTVLNRYCASEASGISGGQIAEVTLGSLVQESAVGCRSYTDYTAVPVQVRAGSEVALEVKLGSCSAPGSYRIKVFADWNSDKDFDEPDETILLSPVQSVGESYVATIQIPASVRAGSNVRLRIVCRDAATSPNEIEACGTYANGETEDYTLEVLDAPVFLLPVSGQTNITTCHGVLYDDGGAEAHYSSQSDGVVVIYPSEAGSLVGVSFTSFLLEECCDVVRVYNGAGISAPLIGAYSANPGTLYATNPAGILTIQLESDFEGAFPGFQANITCAVQAPLPDLMISRAEALYTDVSPASKVPVEVSLYNRGGVAVRATSLVAYLSEDLMVDPPDVYLGAFPIPILPDRHFYTTVLEVPISWFIPIGSCYILLQADGLHQAVESDETNNIEAVVLQIVPPQIDFVVSEAEVTPVAMTAGSVIEISAQLTNAGTASTRGSTLGVYLSSDQLWDAADSALGEIVQPGGILPGGFAEMQASLKMPTGILPGTYYLLVVADPYEQEGETNETNNIAILPITVLGGIVMLHEGHQNYSVCAATVYDNGGTGDYYDKSNSTLTLYPDIAGHYVKLDFLSFALEADADFLYVYNGTSISAPLIGRYSGSSIPGPIYAYNPQGALTLRFYSDVLITGAGFEVAVSCTSIPPLPDLSIDPLAEQLTALSAGESLLAETTVRNLGLTTADVSYTGYFLSEDTLWDTADELLGQSYTMALIPGEAYTNSAYLTIPATTPGGTYYILSVADYQEEIEESDEQNNVVHQKIELTGLATSIQAGFEMGSEIFVSATPNPATDLLQLTLQKRMPVAVANMVVTNVLGVICYEQAVIFEKSGSYRLDISQWPSGVYTATFRIGEKSTTQKIVVVK
jgi:hypothetical protein